jgi:hypothetical protein
LEEFFSIDPAEECGLAAHHPALFRIFAIVGMPTGKVVGGSDDNARVQGGYGIVVVGCFLGLEAGEVFQSAHGWVWWIGG